MTSMRRAAPIVPAVVLAALALSGCGAKEATKEAASSIATASSAASSVMSSASSAAAMPAGDKVAPADLPAVVANRTYRGMSDGQPYAEYYAADGSVRGKTGGEPYTGSWKVVGEQLCFTYPKPGKADEVDCYSVYKNGDAMTWTDSDGALVETTYVEGNPDNL